MGYIFDYIRVLGYLLVILLLFYIFAKYLKKNVESLRRSKYIEIIDSVAVSQKGSIQLAKVGGKTYLLGVTDSNINVIDQVEDAKLEEHTFEKKDFKNLFNINMRREDHIEKD